MNTLYFNAREWRFNPKVKSVGERSFMTDLEGGLSEVYTIGDWDWNWSEICTKYMKLEKNSEYRFVFWLNGGERDDNREVCQLQILFTDADCEETQFEDWANRGISPEEWNNRLIYKLNRGFIKPLKRVRGWELYEIPFRTEEKEFTQMRFVAMAAYMTVMPAKDVSCYADWQDELDEFEGLRPQRHNIIFEDGWPAGNRWYSTEALRKSHKAERQNERNAKAWTDWAKNIGGQAAAEAKKAVQLGGQAMQKGSSTVKQFGDKLSRMTAAEDIRQFVMEKLKFSGREEPDGAAQAEGDASAEAIYADLRKRFLEMLDMNGIVNRAREQVKEQKESDEEAVLEDVLDEVLEELLDALEPAADEARGALDARRDALQAECDRLEGEIDACQDALDETQEKLESELEELQDQMEGALDRCEEVLDDWRDDLTEEFREDLLEQLKEIFTEN